MDSCWIKIVSLVRTWIYTVSKGDIINIIFKMLCTHLVFILLNMVFILGAVSEMGLTHCIRETP